MPLPALPVADLVPTKVKAYIFYRMPRKTKLKTIFAPLWGISPEAVMAPAVADEAQLGYAKLYRLLLDHVSTPRLRCEVQALRSAFGVRGVPMLWDQLPLQLTAPTVGCLHSRFDSIRAHPVAEASPATSCTGVAPVLPSAACPAKLVPEVLQRPSELQGCASDAVHCQWCDSQTTVLQAQRDIAKALRVFTVPENFPVLVHCIHGKDRTGLIIMLIMLLCSIPAEVSLPAPQSCLRPPKLLLHMPGRSACCCAQSLLCACDCSGHGRWCCALPQLEVLCQHQAVPSC